MEVIGPVLTTIMGCVEPVIIANAFQNMRRTIRASEIQRNRPTILRVFIFRGMVVEDRKNV